MFTKRFLQFLLLIGTAFYAFEFVIHFWGLPILEHDKIFLTTHDRYIALYGATYAIILILITTNIPKYRQLFILTMLGILAGMLNAIWIAQNKFYTNNFNAPGLDNDLSVIGWIAVGWYTVVWILFLVDSRAEKK